MTLDTSARLVVQNVTVKFEDRNVSVVALDDVSLGLADGAVMCLLGPSGCGKSTLLRCIAGLQKASSGEVILDGKAVVGPGPDRGMIFQDSGLFPWLSVQKNIEFGLRYLDSSVDAGDKVRQLLELTRLQGFEKALPKQLSGGMRQRVAIARALATEPEILLLDEPFAALDAQTRLTMQTFFMDLIDKERRTAVFVTHDIDEAILVADTIVVMGTRPGRIVAEVANPFPRPRGTAVFDSPEYGPLKARIFEIIRREMGE